MKRKINSIGNACRINYRNCYRVSIFKSRDRNIPVKIITATDIHYLSPSLTDSRQYIQGKRLIAQMAKVIRYIDEIMSAFADEVISAAPDILILSGDLTFNGEKSKPY